MQIEYNKKHNIIPKTIKKDISEILGISSDEALKNTRNYKKISKKEKEKLIETLTKEMKYAAKILEFEHAAFLRDEINKLNIN